MYRARGRIRLPRLERASPFSFLEHPAVHPRLAAARGALAAQWRPGGHLRIERVLAPGLAAELVEAIRLLPLTPRYLSDPNELGAPGQGVAWRCDVGRAAPDPQHPEPLFRAFRFVERDLPALASAALGRPVRPAPAGRLGVWVIRKGSWLECAAPPAGQIVYQLGLTGPRWPAESGAQLEIDGAALPLDWDALDLIGGAHRISLARRHVEGVFLRGALVGEGAVGGTGEGLPGQGRGT